MTTAPTDNVAAQAHIVQRLKCLNSRNDLCSYIALLLVPNPPGFTEPRFVGVVQKGSWADTDPPRLMTVGAEVDMSVESLAMKCVQHIERFPHPTYIPRVTLDVLRQLREKYSEE